MRLEQNNITKSEQTFIFLQKIYNNNKYFELFPSRPVKWYEYNLSAQEISQRSKKLSNCAFLESTPEEASHNCDRNVELLIANHGTVLIRET